MVQTDSPDPQLLVLVERRIRGALSLVERTFVPRGGTPLLDATGQRIARASVRQHERALLGKHPEAVTFVTITDGHENQSREYRRSDIAALLKAKEADGWTFAFLGAGID